MGLLIVSGSLRVDQFWPKGGSDADTATVEVVLNPKTPFVYVNESDVRKPTRVFEGAVAVGQNGAQPVIKYDKRLGANKINVRLQGIDAPELHYQPTVPGSKGKNGKFRQAMGETCSDALYRLLKDFGEQELACEVLSYVRQPSDVCDMFARVVGNLYVGEYDSKLNINHWVVANGWAMPGLYNSMTKSECKRLIAMYEDAKELGRGLHSKKLVKQSMSAFDKDRKYRKGPANFKPFSDADDVNFPKFFRRQAEHHVKRLVDAASVPANYLQFVASKKNDIAIAIKDFLKPGTRPKSDYEQLATFIKNSKYPVGTEVVFFEGDSTLKDKNGKKITKW